MNSTMSKLTTNVPGFPSFRKSSSPCPHRSRLQSFSKRRSEHRSNIDAKFNGGVDLCLRHLYQCQCIVHKSIDDARSSTLHHSDARVSVVLKQQQMMILSQTICCIEMV